MQFTIVARGLGKIVHVYDRIAGANAFDGFLDADAAADVTVASPDGQTGNIDITAQMRADSPLVAVVTDYDVRAGEVIEIGDV